MTAEISLTYPRFNTGDPVLDRDLEILRRGLIERLGVIEAEIGLHGHVAYGTQIVDAFATGIGASAPTLTNFRDGIDLLAFSGGGGPVEEVFFTMHLPPGIDPSADAKFHLHWANNVASGSGDVKWFMEYSLASVIGAALFPASTTMNTVQTIGVQYEHQKTDEADFTIVASADLASHSVLIGRIYRDSSDVEDTCTDNAFLLHLTLHYKNIGLTDAED